MAVTLWFNYPRYQRNEEKCVIESVKGWTCRRRVTSPHYDLHTTLCIVIIYYIIILYILYNIFSYLLLKMLMWRFEVVLDVLYGLFDLNKNRGKINIYYQSHHADGEISYS